MQPAVALAVEFVRRGHSVDMAVPDDLVGPVARTGLPTRVLCPSTAELLASPLVKERLKSRNPRVRVNALREVGAHGSAMSERVMGELAESSDVLVTGPLAQERAASVAESRSIQFIPMHYCPIRPNHHVSPLYRPIPRHVTGLVWHTVDRLVWLTQRRADRTLRRRLGLPVASGTIGTRLRRRGSLEIQAYDAGMFPRLPEEWGRQRPFTGFLLPDEQTRSRLNGGDTRSSLTRVLDWTRSGSSPVYVGFGSMHVAAQRVEFIVRTLLSHGQRVVAQTSHDLPEHGGLLRVPGAIDHEHLFTECRAAVHHGGAGTTAAALRAGIPSVIGWLSADQPMWAAALRDRGAGVGAPLSRLSSADLDFLASDDPYDAARALSADIVAPQAAVDATCDSILTAVSVSTAR